QPSLQWPHGGCPGHEQRLRIYRDLWGRGLQLTPGGKFGGDFLVYPGDPTQMHAAAVALCPTGRVGLSLGALVAAARLGTHVKKSLLIGSSCTEEGGPSRGPAYISLQWRSDL
ncbi:SEN34 endonuclease, partial [Rhinopomastus cyanomelas]|nr:SEN34 endonuclease [Rhinopomastus cyanomelas]